jgi:hypothetical protein
MVVIGDRLFSLLIQVEGRDDGIKNDCQMDMHDRNNGAGQDEKNNDDAPSEGKKE